MSQDTGMNDREVESGGMKISAYSQQVIDQFLQERYNVGKGIIRAFAPRIVLPAANVDWLRASQPARVLQEIAAAAEGLVSWTEDLAQQVNDHCNDIDGLIFSGWDEVPDVMMWAWWQTGVGQIVLRARVWAARDELISLTQASEMTGLALSALSNMIARGRLLLIRDLREPNPTKASRVRLSDVRDLQARDRNADDEL